MLKPAKIDKWTGYRYYSASQLSDLNQILALKELGLSLDQIWQMLDEAISAEELRGMFALKKMQAQQAVRDELARLRSIEARLEQIERGDSFHDFDIIVKSIPERRYLSLRGMYDSFDAARPDIFEMQRLLPSTTGKKNIGYFTAILHSEIYENTDVDLEMGFVLTGNASPAMRLRNGQQLEISILPAITTMVTTVRTGFPDTSHPCRAALASWVESNGYIFDGNGREVFVVPPRPGRVNETVLEIQYPVIKQVNIEYLLT